MCKLNSSSSTTTKNRFPSIDLPQTDKKEGKGGTSWEQLMLRKEKNIYKGKEKNEIEWMAFTFRWWWSRPKPKIKFGERRRECDAQNVCIITANKWRHYNCNFHYNDGESERDKKTWKNMQKDGTLIGGLPHRKIHLGRPTDLVMGRQRWKVADRHCWWWDSWIDAHTHTKKKNRMSESIIESIGQMECVLIVVVDGLSCP